MDIISKNKIICIKRKIKDKFITGFGLIVNNHVEIESYLTIMNSMNQILCQRVRYYGNGKRE